MRRLLNATLMTLACGAVGCGSSGRNQAAVADGPDDAREDVAEDVAEDAGTSGAAAVDADLEEAAPDADDPDAVLSPDQWSVLQGLSPDPLPASPPDATNGFADSPAAAALGQRFFYDPSFSGPLLDTDNDGSLDTLGTAGQTGRVACAGCHIPTSGFSDTRSFQRQISLGAGWGRRRAWSLLDVGQAKLLMWDGRRDALYNQIFGPLETVVEMNSSRLYAAEQIFARYQADYEAVFGPMPPLDDASQFPVLSAQLTGCQPQNPAAPQPVCDGTYHGMPGDHAEFDGMTASNQLAVTTVVVNAGKAIGAFERLLTCGHPSMRGCTEVRRPCPALPSEGLPCLSAKPIASSVTLALSCLTSSFTTLGWSRRSCSKHSSTRTIRGPPAASPRPSLTRSIRWVSSVTEATVACRRWSFRRW
jgi:Di-haem cytochrome c peroxidase